MLTLEIVHSTTYTYSRPVLFGPHRLMLRPRESRDVRVVANKVVVSPDATVTWAHDVAGNTVATATFRDQAPELVISSTTVLQLSAEPWPVFNIAASAISYPFRYDDDDWIDMGALTVRQYPDAAGSLTKWAAGFVAGNPTDTLSLLKDISAGIFGSIAYEAREAVGTQSPLQTLERRSGSCRDFAVLLAEAVRSLGFGARIVSGYLRQPESEGVVLTAAGSTHAWVEIFLTGAGWVTFDPTNRSVGGFNLIPVAVARDIRQTMPVSGSFGGSQDAFRDMLVDVRVSVRPN